MPLIQNQILVQLRKSINQFFKLGFINNDFKGYHSKTREFLYEQNRAKKKILYSEILYDNASFSRSFTNPSHENELKFLVKTIKYCGRITKENLLALMYVTDTINKNYLNKQELEQLTHHINQIHLAKRKYNQIAYLWNICTNVLTGIYLDQDNCLTLINPIMATLKNQSIETHINKPYTNIHSMKKVKKFYLMFIVMLKI